MTANESSIRRDPLTQKPETADVRYLVTLHAQASLHREELLEEARQLLAAGRIREARRLMRTTDELYSQLQAIEAQVRMSGWESR